MSRNPADKSVDEAASTLNELIQTCKDGENGFRAAAESVETPTSATCSRATPSSGLSSRQSYNWRSGSHARNG